MSKADVVAAQKAILIQAQDGALDSFGGACYDQGQAEASPAQGGGLGQADIDAAVLAAVAPLNDKIAQDQVDLQAAHDLGIQALADLQKKLDDMSSAKDADDKLIQGLQGSVAAMQSFLDQIKAFALPVPPVIPVEPSPVDPAPVDPVDPAPAA